VKLNRAFTEFSRRLREASEISRPWKGTIYRVTSLQYHDPNEILTGEGSYRYGGRWNAIRSFRAVYGSVDDVTALKESKANAEYANLRYPFRETRLVVAVEVSLSRVADLTSPQTLKALEITEEELRTEDWRTCRSKDLNRSRRRLGERYSNQRPRDCWHSQPAFRKQSILHIFHRTNCEAAK
jgi:RES domain-containing protein